MKCQIQFSGKNEKTIINLLCAELVQGVVKISFLLFSIQAFLEMTLLTTFQSIHTFLCFLTQILRFSLSCLNMRFTAPFSVISYQTTHVSVYSSYVCFRFSFSGGGLVCTEIRSNRNN